MKDVQKEPTEVSSGLSAAEAALRLSKFGFNELPEERKNPLLEFLVHFWGPIPWMIETAAVLSAVVKRWPDFLIILVLLVMNAVVGFWEEFQAGNAIAALKANLALTARVKRDGEWRTVPARELVPGDLVRLRLGDIIPADATLLVGDPLTVDQSTLTGESLPVTRAEGEGVYSGSTVRQGVAQAIVTATGASSYFGRTAKLVASVRNVSHFQKAVIRISDFLIGIAIVLMLVIVGVALLRGDRFGTVLQFALVLTVAAIPVAMPTVLSVTMAAGARVLARKNVVVTRLEAIEELAGMDVLCSDKTGTLTKNTLALGAPFCVQGVAPEEVLLTAALASSRDAVDVIDKAILDALEAKDQLGAYKVLHFQPFDPVGKRTEALLAGPGPAPFRVTKGAVQVILELVKDAARIRPEVEAAVEAFASHGFRSLGVARSDEQDQWHFLGVLPLFDPPREDTAVTLATALAMGIRVKMVTGDQGAIAQEVARQVGLGPNFLAVEAFKGPGGLDPGALEEAIEAADGFAEVFPEHKFRIVEVLQSHGHITGMTGDGVNDVPALKKADAGIAVQGATGAARAAADLVLLTMGLSVIIDAIKESRRIFQRMNSYAVYRISETIRVLLFMTLSILVFNFYPVTAVMIVLLALLNDGAILAIAFDRVRYANRPEVWEMPKVLTIASVLGLMGVIASFLLFFLCEKVFRIHRDLLQTMMYLKLSVAGHLTIFLTRTRGTFWSIAPAPILLAAVVGTQLVATVIAVFGLGLMPAIGWTWAAAIWGYALVWFFLNDVVKQVAYRWCAWGREPGDARL